MLRDGLNDDGNRHDGLDGLDQLDRHRRLTSRGRHMSRDARSAVRMSRRSRFVSPLAQSKEER
jgi:hypothetical protein